MMQGRKHEQVVRDPTVLTRGIKQGEFWSYENIDHYVMSVKTRKNGGISALLMRPDERISVFIHTDTDGSVTEKRRVEGDRILSDLIAIQDSLEKKKGRNTGS